MNASALPSPDLAPASMKSAQLFRALSFLTTFHGELPLMPRTEAQGLTRRKTERAGIPLPTSGALTSLARRLLGE